MTTATISDTLNGVLLALHAGSRRQALDEFKNWALDLVSTVIPFEKAHWGSGVLVDKIFVLYGTHLRGTDPGFEERFNEKGNLDTRFNEGAARGLTLLRDSHDPADTNQEFRRYVLDPCGVRYGLQTAMLDASTSVFDGVVLMRSAESKPFSENERQTLATLFPHLAQACALNRLERSQDMLDQGRRAAYHCLVTTRDGLLVAADSAATQMILSEWPDWKGGRLPPLLVEAIMAENALPSFEVFSNDGALMAPTEKASKVGSVTRAVDNFLIRCQNFVARIHIDDAQVLLRLRPLCVIDNLGQRELAVAERYAAGASYKDIAKALGLSPSTVNNQLSAVYLKLGITHKIALRRELEHWR